jgi:hypothetical protein
MAYNKRQINKKYKYIGLIKVSYDMRSFRMKNQIPRENCFFML